MTTPAHSQPQLAVVITVFNEAENVIPVCQELGSILASLSSPNEVVIVDDGSSDATLEKLFEARRTVLPQLRIFSHSRRLGKSASLRTAIQAARAPWIATMDGDGQDDPATIPHMLQTALAYDKQCKIPLIVAVRRHRRDRLSRRVATLCANKLRSFILKDGCPDTGAPLKLFPRDLFLAMPQFEGLHRFLPALMNRYGAQLVCLTTQHRHRLSGSSKYTNLGRAIAGIRDLLGVLWLQARARPSGYPTEL
ncbi:glycosyltransferase [Saccharibacter sp. 17.LH.SD]|uniref:glycosyltransferase family 2 protein n=1 Tax=Saccharibacter sp. 17.LH.SD TaxID=2689393 RepID=UPI00136868CA|nr:glycosyltransferase family 2 protein [Saccharibacter sp. 17.LH.SD]MXV45111.1 glycosyltransferase [Saccharibacter sp. 17.LH.SD]